MIKPLATLFSCLLLILATGCCCHDDDSYCAYTPRIIPCECDLDEFGHHTAHKYGLRFLLVERIKNRSCVIFTSDQQLELAAGRKLALPVVRDFLHMLSHCPIERVDQTNCAVSYIKYEPQVHKISLKIAFWDKSINRPKSPYLAEIFFSKGIFYYYEADPTTQALRLVAEESYEETVKNTKYQRVSFSQKIL